MTPDFRNPLKRARNIGSAKSGAGAWMAMQFTSLVLVALGIWFVVLVLSMVHGDYASIRHRIGHPANATLMILFVTLAAWHTELGLRNIYDDYIQKHWLRFWSVVITRFTLILLTVLTLLSILRLALAH